MAISAMSQLEILRIGVLEAGMEVKCYDGSNRYYVYHNGVPLVIMSLVDDQWMIHVESKTTGIWSSSMVHHGRMSTRHAITRLLALVEDPLL
jgi:hypothetical protein